MMVDKYEALTKKALQLGASEAKVIDADRIVFDPRSYLKCRFGCNRWGRYWTCPPNLHLSPDEFMEAFKKYDKAIIIKTSDPEVGQDVTLAIEKDAMLNHSSHFAFALALCVKCTECAYPEPCLYPHLARPSLDAYGVDISKTVAPLDFEVEFDQDGTLLPAWYSMVLVD